MLLLNVRCCSNSGHLLRHNKRSQRANSGCEQMQQVAPLLDHLVGSAFRSLSGIVMPRRPLACQATERRNGTRGPALLGGEAIEQPVAAGAAQVGLATAAIGPARGMR